MRILPALLLTLALPANAETISQELARTGLAATEARLAALAAPTDADRFALGGVQFLRAIEGSFQERWAMGLTDRLGLLPLLRLPVADNPSPTAFEPAAIVTLFAHAEARFVAAEITLASLPDTSGFALEIDLDDLWFDVNANTTRDPGEGLMNIAGSAVLDRQLTLPELLAPAPVIRFDVADAAWLSAYAHLLTGISQVVLAYDPTELITRIMTARATMAQWGPAPRDWLSNGRVPDLFDMVAMIIATLDQQPDAALLLSARDHLLACITENRRFWALVAMETDNAAEWLPNDVQTSGLGVALPPGIGAAWQGVLADAEAILLGDKLVPYSRVGDLGGVNLARVFTDPRPVDVAGWIQGWAALPYLESGTLASQGSWRAFENLVGGDPMLLSIWLN